MWGYPLVLSSHAVGMAILAGIVIMVNLRILGFAPGIRVYALKPLFKVAMVGLVINLVSGLMLFAASANKFFENNPFRIKVVLLIVGGVLLVMMARQFFRDSDPLENPEANPKTKMLAALAIIVWLGVIVSGRLIAYFDTGFYY